MKTRIAFLLLVVVVVLSEVQGQGLVIEPCLAWMKPQPTCPVNERYTCCKTCFELTCRTRNIAVKCAPPCYGGCICRDGYIRAVTNGKCIPIKSCPLIFPIV
ncbi:venom peptide SjAPI-2-like [Anopheles funestus]|uniref:venom peptide SjAPI-2-like n=1 Tax=Anopheles funestus TaxID=62324 RepID=UPI0020C73EBC|nr:venom peptide SjAPI-2-like [Anopheles funestus]